MCFHLQYACCLKYDIQWGHTAHLFTHQINIDYKELQTAIYKFALDNQDWLQKVSADALNRADLTVEDFLKGLHNESLIFDELCIILTCHVFNVHCVVLLDGSYWCTWPNNEFHDCLIKIAYVDDFGFKEVQTQLYQTINDEALKENQSDGSCSDDDLWGTGLVDQNQNDNTEEDQD